MIVSSVDTFQKNQMIEIENDVITNEKVLYIIDGSPRFMFQSLRQSSIPNDWKMKSKRLFEENANTMIVNSTLP